MSLLVKIFQKLNEGAASVCFCFFRPEGRNFASLRHWVELRIFCSKGQSKIQKQKSEESSRDTRLLSSAVISTRFPGTSTANEIFSGVASAP